MEQVTIKLTPKDNSIPTLQQVTNNLSYTFNDVTNGSYDYTITSQAYQPVSGTLEVNSNQSVNITLIEIVTEPVITWVPKTRTRSKAYTIETQYDPSLLPSESYTIAGKAGVETQNYELKYIDGVPTSEERNLSAWQVTTAPKNEVQIIGTKVETPSELTNILTPSNVRLIGNTDLQINGERAALQTVSDLSKVELRQWADGFGGISIGADDLVNDRDYTIVLKYRIIKNISSIRTTGNMAFWRHKAFINNVLVSEGSGGDVAKDNFSVTTGQDHTFVYQFNTGTQTLSQNIYRVIFNEDKTGVTSTNDAILHLFDVAIYQGHVNPFV